MALKVLRDSDSNSPMKGLTQKMKKQKKKQPLSIALQARGTSSRISPLSQQRSRAGELLSLQFRVFNVKLYVIEAQELYTVPDCYRELTIKNLKSRLELFIGIPVNFQRLQYLDEVDLADDSTFRKNDIIPGGTLTMRIWPEDAWGRLVSAAAKGKIRMVGSDCLCKYVDISSAKTALAAWSLKSTDGMDLVVYGMAGVQLEKSRGSLSVELPTSEGADLRRKTPLGRTALHVAVTSGHADCINLLLDWGAKINDEDNEGLNAVHLARLWGQKESERQLFKHQWKVRARQSVNPLNKPT